MLQRYFVIHILMISYIFIKLFFSWPDFVNRPISRNIIDQFHVPDNPSTLCPVGKTKCGLAKRSSCDGENN